MATGSLCLWDRRLCRASGLARP